VFVTQFAAAVIAKTCGLLRHIAHHRVHQGPFRLNEVSENTGNLEKAMGHARHLLAEDPGRAIIQLDEVLAVVPDYPPALLLKASAINRINGPEASLELLAPLATQHGQWPAVHFEHAKTLSVPLPPAALINTVFGRAQERSGFAGPRSSDLSAGKNKKGHLIRWPFF